MGSGVDLRSWRREEGKVSKYLLDGVEFAFGFSLALG